MENDETMIPDKDVSVFKTPKGINEDIVREISAIKGEPEWMLEYRLKALDCFLKKPMPTWGVDLSRVDFVSIRIILDLLINKQINGKKSLKRLKILLIN